MIQHKFTLKFYVDSESAHGTMLLFCERCGSPQKKPAKRLGPCIVLSKSDINKRIEARLLMLAAMIGGGHQRYKKG